MNNTSWSWFSLGIAIGVMLGIIFCIIARYIN